DSSKNPDAHVGEFGTVPSRLGTLDVMFNRADLALSVYSTIEHHFALGLLGSTARFDNLTHYELTSGYELIGVYDHDHSYIYSASKSGEYWAAARERLAPRGLCSG